ncbi:hypothetical protein GCM10023189_29690 [Nibrella saemangeumensis]|uniref:Uncharacterized protein n=1 Tax=Nibrella saemangeumensis TaxID=1084526 RepID=A0ABP8MY21_9BACT
MDETLGWLIGAGVVMVGIVYVNDKGVALDEWADDHYSAHADIRSEITTISILEVTEWFFLV